MKKTFKIAILLCLTAVMMLLMVSCNDLLIRLPFNTETISKDITTPEDVTTIVPHVHIEEILERVEPTCVEVGLTDGKRCSDCGEVLVVQETIPANGHTEVVDVEVKSTCTETGLTEGKHCLKCDEILVAQEIIPAHHYVSIFVAPTAKEDGYTKHTCSNCGDTYITDVIVPIDFTITEGNRQMIGYSGTDNEILIIPETFEDNDIWYRVTSIGDRAFHGCDNLTNITIPSGVMSISSSAFLYCNQGLFQIENGISYLDKWVIDCDTDVTFATLREHTVGIGDYAFDRCDSLTSIEIPDGVTSIGNRAFNRCDSLTSITIPDSVISIGERVLSMCSGLNSVTVTSGNPVYYSDGNCIIERASKILIQGCNNSIIPQDIIAVGNYAFFNCDNLASVVIPDGIMSIGDSAFGNCDNITSIMISAGVTSIGDDAFYGCGSLNSITVASENPVYYSEGNCLIERESKLLIKGCDNSIIPQDIISISDYAFFECDNLTSVTIPDGVTSIGDGTFWGCSNLTTITIPDSVMSISSSAFYLCNKGLFQIENGISYVDKWIIDCDTNVTSAILRKNTVGIGNEAFLWCDSLTTITIPDSVKSIGDSAFSGCDSLTTITIPDSIKSIGDSAFSGCDSLTTITINGVISIGDSAFCWCENLTTITIPDGVMSINDSTFCWCDNLKSITIPDSVTSIGDHAFAWCYSLTSITFKGTIEQWDSIQKLYCWDFCTDTYTIYCTDGEIAKDGTVTYC